MENRIVDEETLSVANEYKARGSILACDLLTNQSIICDALQEGRAFRVDIPLGHESYFRTVIGSFKPHNFLLPNTRGLEIFQFPWMFITLNAIMWTCVAEGFDIDTGPMNVEINFFITACLAFLLVFRINRVAVRWWDTRTNWGKIVEVVRVLTIEIMEHVDHAPSRDKAVRWLFAYTIATKELLRLEEGSQIRFNYKELNGILSLDEIKQMESVPHPAMYCMCEVRNILKRAMQVNSDVPVSLAVMYESNLRMLEKSINILIAQVGGMERVKATPLPIIYVTHTRTMMILYLFLIPYVSESEWGWYTIPTVSVLAYALLGIDAAAHECGKLLFTLSFYTIHVVKRTLQLVSEVPFSANRINHLDMELYCISSFRSIVQIVCHSIDMQERVENE